MKSIINQLKLRWDELLFGAAGNLAGIVFAIIICVIVSLLAKDQEKTLWGSGIISLMSFLFGMLFTVFMHVLAMQIHFNLAVGMCKSRKEFILWHLVLSVMQFIIVYLISAIVYFIESRNGSCDIMDLSMIFRFPVMAGIILGGTILCTLVGTCILKYGYKVLWVFWAIWMILCLLPSHIIHHYQEHTGSLFDKMGQIFAKAIHVLPKEFYFIAGVLTLLIFLACSVRVLLKQEVVY